MEQMMEFLLVQMKAGQEKMVAIKTKLEEINAIREEMKAQIYVT
jgi:hypothetical protein